MDDVSSFRLMSDLPSGMLPAAVPSPAPLTSPTMAIWTSQGRSAHQNGCSSSGCGMLVLMLCSGLHPVRGKPDSGRLRIARAVCCTARVAVYDGDAMPELNPQ